MSVTTLPSAAQTDYERRDSILETIVENHTRHVPAIKKLVCDKSPLMAGYSLKKIRKGNPLYITCLNVLTSFLLGILSNHITQQRPKRYRWSTTS